MPKEKSHRAKTQTLSLRLDPKSRFVLEFVAKLRKQSITTVVEQAIYALAGSEHIEPWDKESKTWKDFWNVNEGVRTMLMLAQPIVTSSYEDDELRDFIKEHIEFFSTTNELENPDRLNLEVLWPSIYEILEHWHENKRNDPWSTGHIMAERLTAAGVEPPEWPRPGKTPPKPRSKMDRSDFSQELDDEIPF